MAAPAIRVYRVGQADPISFAPGTHTTAIFTDDEIEAPPTSSLKSRATNIKYKADSHAPNGDYDLIVGSTGRDGKRKSLPLPTSGNQWKADFLTKLRIQIEPTLSLAQLLGGGDVPPLSEMGQSVLQACEIITAHDVASYIWQPKANANDIGTTLLKYLRLIVGTEKMGLESVVDDMVIHLFAALGFNAGRLLILSKNTLKFTMNKSTCEATADVTVYDVTSRFRLAVIEDKRDPINSSPSNLEDNEAQLIAEAIAAAQANYGMPKRVDQPKRPRAQTAPDGAASSAVAQAASAAAASASEPPPERLFLVRVIGDQFSFYSTCMSSVFLKGIADYSLRDAKTTTTVYRLQTETHVPQDTGSGAGSAAAAAASSAATGSVVTADRWQLKVPEERQIIIEALDRFRQAMLKPAQAPAKEEKEEEKEKA